MGLGIQVKGGSEGRWLSPNKKPMRTLLEVFYMITDVLEPK